MNETSIMRGSGCSGNGYVCLPMNKCICDTGWTSVGDYSIIDGVDCDINKASVKGLSVIDICQSSIFVVAVTRYLVVRLLAKKAMKVTDPKILAPIAFLIFGVCDLVIALLKVVYKEPQIIGRDVMFSAISTLFSFSVFLGLTAYYLVILQFLKGYARLMTSASREKVNFRFSVLRACSWVIVPLCVPTSLSSLLSPFYPKYMQVFAMVQIIGSGVLVFIYGVMFITALGLLMIELNSHIEVSKNDHDIQLVYRRIKAAYYIGGTLIIGGSSSMIIFGAWPFLLRKSTYMLLFVRIIGVPLFSVLLVTLCKIAPHRRSESLLPVIEAFQQQKPKIIEVISKSSVETNITHIQQYRSNYGDVKNGSSLVVVSCTQDDFYTSENVI